MIFELGDFMGCGLRSRDRALAGRVTGFVVDDAAWALRYVLVRLDRDPAQTQRLLPTAAFPPVARLDDDQLTACLTPDEFARGLPLTGRCESLTRDKERSLHDTLHWMPYWKEPAPEGPCTLHDASRALGAPLTCCGELFGHVDNLLVDTQDWRVIALCIRIAGDKETGRMHLPTSFIHTADWVTPGFDSDVRAAVLACAPEVEGTDLPGSDYFDRLQQHLSRH